MSTEPVRVTVVTARDCHLCEDALQALAMLGQVHRVSVEDVAAHSPKGRALVLAHGTGMFPLVLVGGQFFSAGRLPRRKLARYLAEHAATRAGVR